MNGAPSTVHRADLFFSTPPPVPQNRPSSRHSYSAGNSSAAQNPRLPLKLNRSRTTSPQTHLDTFMSPPPPPPLKFHSQSTPDSPADQAELQTIIQLSKSESERQDLLLEKLSNQEEDDLAQALAESIRMSEKTSISSPVAGPSRPPVVPIHTRPYSQSLPSPSRRSCESRQLIAVNEAVPANGNRSKSLEIEDPALATWSSPPLNSASLLDDEALARQLAQEEAREEERLRESTRISTENLQPALEDDEAFARQLALEEEEDDKHEEPITPAAVNTPPLPPAYSDVVSPPSSNTDSSLFRSDSSTSSTSYISSSEGSRAPSRPFQPTRSSNDDVGEKSRLSTPGSRPSLRQLETEHTMGAINVNEFVDKELLQGVSIGFYDPVVQDQAQPMAGIMPNIISLPYGKSPPLHLQATSWRHLLKLMARLSGTRIEPTAQATERNEDLYLRTVIQFVRPHYNSSTWRTVVWFTIDQDADRPQSRRIINPSGEVERLPYSYSQMKLPALLRDGSDSPLSKTYTIPSTHSVPYPVLPISFPNLTLYLQAALDESRRYLNDSSSGMRKFAKMLEHCFPDEFDSGARTSEKSRVTGLFKRVIGRGAKSSRKGRGGNEETYDLVTPFVPDEWG
ncbi:hypothetical protein GGU11DRAFT_767063 [Lentinula aff. detonsa]|nr:hypothetical protein GGU11DRAFT_767063 [Lentinula aff. detonsa]